MQKVKEKMFAIGKKLSLGGLKAGKKLEKQENNQNEKIYMNGSGMGLRRFYLSNGKRIWVDPPYDGYICMNGKRFKNEKTP
tara:strand:- start:373 stop:615 length:243 start_codon:yes stop_codon:yes gene_type:complete